MTATAEPRTHLVISYTDNEVNVIGSFSDRDHAAQTAAEGATVDSSRTYFVDSIRTIDHPLAWMELYTAELIVTPDGQIHDYNGHFANPTRLIIWESAKEFAHLAQLNEPEAQMFTNPQGIVVRSRFRDRDSAKSACEVVAQEAARNAPEIKSRGTIEDKGTVKFDPFGFEVIIDTDPFGSPQLSCARCNHVFAGYETKEGESLPAEAGVLAAALINHPILCERAQEARDTAERPY